MHMHRGYGRRTSRRPTSHLMRTQPWLPSVLRAVGARGRTRRRRRRRRLLHLTGHRLPVGAQSRAGHSSCRHWVGWRWLNAEPASSAVQVGFFCPARAFGACTSNPEHSTAPRGRDGNPHHQTLCVLRPACPPPGPTLPAPPAWGGMQATAPPGLQVPDIRSSGGGGLGFGGGCPAWKWELCPPRPCPAWAGLQAGGTGGLPALGGSRPCRRHRGALPRLRGHAAGASATPDRVTNDDNRSRRWLCSRARFRVAATMGNVASHLSRGGNYASRAGEHARSTA